MERLGHTIAAIALSSIEGCAEIPKGDMSPVTTVECADAESTLERVSDAYLALCLRDRGSVQVARVGATCETPSHEEECGALATNTLMALKNVVDQCR